MKWAQITPTDILDGIRAALRARGVKFYTKVDKGTDEFIIDGARVGVSMNRKALPGTSMWKAAQGPYIVRVGSENFQYSKQRAAGYDYEAIANAIFIAAQQELGRMERLDNIAKNADAMFAAFAPDATPEKRWHRHVTLPGGLRIDATAERGRFECRFPSLPLMTLEQAGRFDQALQAFLAEHLPKPTGE